MADSKQWFEELKKRIVTIQMTYEDAEDLVYACKVLRTQYLNCGAKLPAEHALYMASIIEDAQDVVEKEYSKEGNW